MSESPEYIQQQQQQQQNNAIQDWPGQNFGLSCDKFGDMAWMPLDQNANPLLASAPTTNGDFAMDLCQSAYTTEVSPMEAMQQQMDANDTVMPSQISPNFNDGASSINSVSPSPFSYENPLLSDAMMGSTHTSPTDINSPASAISQPQIKLEPGTKRQSIQEHKKRGTAARQRRRSSQHSITSPITKSATIATTTIPAAPSAADTASNPPPATEGKKKTIREKNRTAATKYRNKTKRSIADLQETEHQLSEKNAVLSAHVDCLRNEILTLKNEILRHGTCESSMIQEYIMKTAKQL